MNAVLSRIAATWPADLPAIVRLPDNRAVELAPGPAPLEVHVRHPRAFARIALRGEMGAGEAYVAGEWDADDLAAVALGFLRATGGRGVESWLTRLALLPTRLRHRLRRNDRRGARANVSHHYDLGEPFYRLFLDDDLVYSCAIWRDGDDLARAQHRKLERVLELAEVGRGDRVLELGCGWGALARAAARRGADVTAVTVSADQARHCERAGVRVLHRDYRDVGGRFDRVLSVEMLEQVGLAYLPTFFAALARRLRPGGRAVVQTITMPDARASSYRRGVDWMQTYVFPGTEIPHLAAIRDAAARAGLRVASVDEIGPSYAPTLRAWRDRFTAAAPAVRALGFDDRFVRTWRLYLAFSEAAFAARTLGDAQITLVR